MAAIDFPNPSAQNPDTGDQYANGWFNAANGVTYVYANNTWSAAKVNNSNFDDLYVNESGGDHMQGPLTIGPDGDVNNATIELNAGGTAEFADDVTIGTDKITLDATTGGATFAGEVQSKVTKSSNSFTFNDLNADFHEFRNVGDDFVVVADALGGAVGKQQAVFLAQSQPADNVSYAYEVRNGNANSRMVIGINGDICLANSSGNASVEAERTVWIKPSGSAEFAGDVRIGDVGGAGTFTFVNGAGNITVRTSQPNAIVVEDFNDGNKQNILLKKDGSASFANTVTVTSGDFKSGVYGIVTSNNSGTSAFVAQSTMTNGSGNLWRGFPFDKSVTGGDFTSQISANGDYFFAGTGSFRNAILNLEPDNDANYVTTTDVDEDGNTVETRVYNGPTLDVKEKLMEAMATIEDLKTRLAALEGGGATAY